MSDREILDYVAICRLQAAYADAVTRRAWSDLDELFLPDAPVQVDTVTSAPIELVGAAGIGNFVSGAVERFEFFELVILNVHVLADPDADSDAQRSELRSRSFTCELRQERANGHWTNAFGIYHDNLRRVGGRWRYARRRYQSLARTGRSQVFPFPQPAGFE
ncbi:MAG: nuclear transport factor 2 family protein [Acidimicrobiia bacterium]